MEFAKPKGRFNIVDPDRQVGAATLGAVGFVPDAASIGPNRPLAPDDDDALGLIELLLHFPPPFRPGSNLRIPPDSETVRFKGLDKRRDPRAVLGLIRNEHVAHPKTPEQSHSAMAELISQLAGLRIRAGKLEPGPLTRRHGQAAAPCFRQA